MYIQYGDQNDQTNWQIWNTDIFCLRIMILKHADVCTGLNKTQMKWVLLFLIHFEHLFLGLFTFGSSFTDTCLWHRVNLFPESSNTNMTRQQICPIYFTTRWVHPINFNVPFNPVIRQNLSHCKVMTHWSWQTAGQEWSYLQRVRLVLPLWQLQKFHNPFECAHTHHKIIHRAQKQTIILSCLNLNIMLNWIKSCL